MLHATRGEARSSCATQAALESDDEPEELEPPEELELPEELEPLSDELELDAPAESELPELAFEAEPAELYRSEYQPPPFRMKPPPSEI